MIRPLAILALLCAPALAQTPCTSHECSDDSAVPPIAGNERVAWDRVDGARSYELSTDGASVCAQLAPRWRMYHPTEQRLLQYVWLAGWPMCYPPEGQRVSVRVRACDDAGCSAWTATSVELIGQPYRCFTAEGETPCNFQGATP